MVAAGCQMKVRGMGEGGEPCVAFCRVVGRGVNPRFHLALTQCLALRRSSAKVTYNRCLPFFCVPKASQLWHLLTTLGNLLAALIQL